MDCFYVRPEHVKVKYFETEKQNCTFYSSIQIKALIYLKLVSLILYVNFDSIFQLLLLISIIIIGLIYVTRISKLYS